MPQFIHFKNEIGLDDLILSFSSKKGGGGGGRKLSMCFLTEIIPEKIRSILSKK